MEDASCTDETLRLYRELREARLDNVGIVLQAYLRRTLDDIQALSDLTPNVRPLQRDLRRARRDRVPGVRRGRENFVRALGALLEGGSYVGIATHDEWLIAEESGSCARRAIAVRLRVPDAARRQAPACNTAGGAGHRLRIYVPYGEEWYAYSLRRLQENPKIAGYIASDTIGRLLSSRNGPLI